MPRRAIEYSIAGNRAGQNEISLVWTRLEKARKRGRAKQAGREVVNINMIFQALCKENQCLKNLSFNLFVRKNVFSEPFIY